MICHDITVSHSFVDQMKIAPLSASVANFSKIANIAATIIASITEKARTIRRIMMMNDVMGIASVMCKSCEEVSGGCCKDKPCGNVLREARRIYDAGYRKQSEGEWEQIGLQNPKCSLCRRYNYEKSTFCPNCGAKMKGGAE